MAKVTENHPDGAGEEQVWPVGVLADHLPPVGIADIKAARQEALLGRATGSRPAGEGRSTKGE
jgi:hypothetical protein